MSLSLIKFSAALHLSGVQPNNIGGESTGLVPRQAAQPATVKAIKDKIINSLCLYLFMAAVSEHC